MERQSVADALAGLKNGTIEHHIHLAHCYPLFTMAKLEDILEAALSIVEVAEIEAVLKKSGEKQSSSDEVLLSALGISDENRKRAEELLLQKNKPLKTQPIYVLETKRVIRAQGRPPKEVKPIYVQTEEEAYTFLQQQNNHKNN